MSRALLFASFFLVACSGEARREPTPVGLGAVRAQLAKVIAPEPAGTLRIDLGDDAATIERDPGVSLVMRPLDRPAKLARLDERTRSASRDGVDVFHVASAGRFEELRHVHHALERIELRYAIALGPRLARLRVSRDVVEALDFDDVARLRTEPAFAVDAKGSVRALIPRVEGETLIWSADAADLAPPIAIDPAWTTTSSMVKARSGGQAFPIGGKRVLVYGGSFDATTEIYDDATSSFTLGPALSLYRVTRAVQLDDGHVFVPAGDATGAESPPRGEVLDLKKTPLAWKLSAAAPFAYGGGVYGIAMKGGKAFVEGLPGASIYDAKTDTWTATTGAPLQARNRYRGAQLGDGRVLIVGGTDGTNLVKSSELFDPMTQTFAAAGDMSTVRNSVAVLALPSGKAIAIGGDDAGATGTIFDTTEIFDPTTKTWSAGPKMHSPRSYVGTVLLPDGRVMALGGGSPAGVVASTEILDPVSKTSLLSGSLSGPRESVMASLVLEGEWRVIAMGGYVGNNVKTAERFDPLATGKPCADPGECSGGFCVDGVCCEKSACAADETCGGAAAPGSCRKNLGAACSKGDDCGSGTCVDGVCCDRACDGTCEACDVASSKGRCTTLAPGEAPHAGHPKCPGEGVCSALCGGVDAKTCTVFPGAATRCAEPSCKDGVESLASSCDGAGACAMPVTGKCDAYVCGERACKHACEVDGDCASGYSCDTRAGRCVFGAKCDGDHTVAVPGAASIDCTPYKCAGASCLQKCAASSDCIDGTTCDTATGACVGPQAAADSGGGCSTSHTKESYGGVALLAIAALLFARKEAA